MTCLQTLPCFIVGQDAGQRVEELGCLNQLRGKLNLWNLEHVRNKEEARRANLEKKGQNIQVEILLDETGIRERRQPRE